MTGREECPSPSGADTGERCQRGVNGWPLGRLLWVTKKPQGSYQGVHASRVMLPLTVLRTEGGPQGRETSVLLPLLPCAQGLPEPRGGTVPSSILLPLASSRGQSPNRLLQTLLTHRGNSLSEHSGSSPTVGRDRAGDPAVLTVPSTKPSLWPLISLSHQKGKGQVASCQQPSSQGHSRRGVSQEPGSAGREPGSYILLTRASG